MPLVKCGPDAHINAAHISTIEWDRRDYAYGSGSAALIVHMIDGRAIRINHNPHMMDGVDCHKIERELVAAALYVPSEPVELVAEVRRRTAD